MKQLFLRAVGKVVSHRLAIALMIRYSTSRPEIRDLYDLDGSLYMARAWLVTEGTWQSKVLEFFTGYSSARLHLIMRSDHDRDLHNHPFEYRTFVLKGYYSEDYQARDVWTDENFPRLVPEVKSRTAFAGDTLTSYSTLGYHRITQVSHGGVMTLFLMTDNWGEWGFDTPEGYRESSEYLADKGYRQPGKDV